DLAAVRALDGDLVPVPVGPAVVARLRDAGDRHVGRRRVALRVVPDEDHAVLHHRGPGGGAGAQRDAAGVGDGLAAAVAAPAPVVEGAGDLVALDRALGEVSAHVAAVGVQHVDVA